jgi:hypothetical protein
MWSWQVVAPAVFHAYTITGKWPSGTAHTQRYLIQTSAAVLSTSDVMTSLLITKYTSLILSVASETKLPGKYMPKPITIFHLVIMQYRGPQPHYWTRRLKRIFSDVRASLSYRDWHIIMYNRFIGYEHINQSEGASTAYSVWWPHYGLDNTGIVVPFPSGAREVACPKRPDSNWGPSSLLFNGHGGSFPGSKAASAWIWSIAHLVPKLKNAWIYTFTPSYAVMAWTGAILILFYCKCTRIILHVCMFIPEFSFLFLNVDN